jgi:hypothetical protein
MTFKKKLVQGCTDYDKLKFFQYNRSSDVRKDLGESMRDIGFIDEIKVVQTSIVNGRKELYVVDGQNRLKTAKAMNLPFDYIIVKEVNTKEDIIKLVTAYNSKHKVWKPMDYVNMYTLLCNEHYTVLKAKCIEHKMSPTALSIVFTGNGSNVKKKLMDGHFKITHRDFGEKVINEIVEIMKSVKVSSKFIQGFSLFYSVCPDYNRSKFIKGLSIYSAKYEKVDNTSLFRDIFMFIHSNMSK